MMMFVQLLMFTCACALGAADEMPPYGDIFDSIFEAWEKLNDNILSMDGNIPLVNDPRRHYAEIIHVVHDEAKHENDRRSSSVVHPYYTDYQRNINKSAPFAVANPQSVVDGTKKVIDDILRFFNPKVLQLVNTKKATDEEINKNVEKNIWPIIIATGRVAEQLNQDHKDYFAASSQNRNAHNFVITGAEKLKSIVMNLRDLYALLYPNPPTH